MMNTLARDDPGAPIWTCSKASIVCGTPSSSSSTSLAFRSSTDCPSRDAYMSTRTEFVPVRLVGPLCARSDTAASRMSRMRAARRTETPVAGWLWQFTALATTPNHQLPTTNHYQFPTPKACDAASSWVLAVGSGWELVVARWEFVRGRL